MKDVITNCTSPDRAVAFAIACVPEPIRHVRAICDNQRYMIACMLNTSKMPYLRRKALCEALTLGIEVRGVLGTECDYWDLLDSVDADIWRACVERDDKG